MEQDNKDIGEANGNNREIPEITGHAIYEVLVEYVRQCGLEVCLYDLVHDSFWGWDTRPEYYCPNSGLTSFLCARFGVTPDQIEIRMHEGGKGWPQYTVAIGYGGEGLFFDSCDLKEDIMGGQALIPWGKNRLEADDIEESFLSPEA